jgi:hypothetical protein
MCVAGRYFETTRASQPVAEEKAEVSPGNRSSERDLTTTDRLLKDSSYIPNTETRNSIYFYNFSCIYFLRVYITALVLSLAHLSERTRILQVTL